MHLLRRQYIAKASLTANLGRPKVTAMDGPRHLLEIDGRPAGDVYRETDESGH